MTAGDMIREARSRHAISQQVLALRAGTDQAAISWNRLAGRLTEEGRRARGE